MPFQLSLDNRVALITGGSRGIGAATVRVFVEAGARVLFTYEKARVQAENLCRELGTERCVAFACNLSGTETAAEAVAATVAKFGRLDVLIANHGIWPPVDVPIDSMSDSQWQKTIDVNLNRQPKNGSAAGHIVLVSSTSAQRGEQFHCDYAATKGALISMVKGLSTELAPHAIYVNSVAPGWVDTDMSRPALDDPRTSKQIFQAIPLGRVGTPEEIAAPILFLCTSHAGFITGEVFNVNGGAVLVG
jgi:3-oxoacyl-[acyl-carrier protein] reductase